MQYSNNSDEAMRAIIRSCPTLAGQYRQAMLEKKARKQALALFRFDLRRHQATLKMKRAGQLRIEQRLAASTDQIERLELEAKLELNAIALEEAEYKLLQTSELVEDSMRELAAVNAELERIALEAGCDLGALPPPQFQQLMSDEFKLRRARWIAARSLAALQGIAPEAAEALLEIPESDRAEYLNLHWNLLEAFERHSAAIQSEIEDTAALEAAQ